MFPKTSLERNAMMGWSTAQMGHGDIWAENKLLKQESELNKSVTKGGVLVLIPLSVWVSRIFLTSVSSQT